MTVFERIKEISKQRGINVKQAALKAGLSENAIYKWKVQTPQSDALQSVADVLGVSVDYLLGNTDEMHSTKTYAAESDDLKEYFQKHTVLKFDGKEIPETEMKIIRRILEEMDD